MQQHVINDMVFMQQHVIHDMVFCWMESTVRKHACRPILISWIHNNSLIAAISVICSQCTVDFHVACLVNEEKFLCVGMGWKEIDTQDSNC
jgi:hypothetical protein